MGVTQHRKVFIGLCNLVRVSAIRTVQMFVASPSDTVRKANEATERSGLKIRPKLD